MVSSTFEMLSSTYYILDHTGGNARSLQLLQFVALIGIFLLEFLLTVCSKLELNWHVLQNKMCMCVRVCVYATAVTTCMYVRANVCIVYVC